jgi:hypothetical protein
LGWQKQAMVLDLKRMQLSALARAPGHKLECWQIAENVGGTDAETPSASTLEMRINRLVSAKLAV